MKKMARKGNKGQHPQEGQEDRKGRREGFDLGPLVAELRDWIVWIGFAVILSFVVGNVLNAVMGSTVPLVAIMSGSMEHDSTEKTVHYAYLEAAGFSREEIDAFPIKKGFSKGAVLVVKGRETLYKVGDVIVFEAPGAKYPIIHRIIGISRDSADKPYYRTKGDHNPSEDRWLIPHDKVKGKAVFVIPFLGYVKVVPMEACTALGFCSALYG